MRRIIIIARAARRCIDFSRKTVLHADPQSPDFVEKGFTPEKPGDLLALFNRTLPKNALNYAQIVEEWVLNAQKQNAGAPDRERVTLALAADWPEKVLEETRRRSCGFIARRRRRPRRGHLA